MKLLSVSIVSQCWKLVLAALMIVTLMFIISFGYTARLFNQIHTGTAHKQQLISGTRWAPDHFCNRVCLAGKNYLSLGVRR